MYSRNDHHLQHQLAHHQIPQGNTSQAQQPQSTTSHQIPPSSSSSAIPPTNCSSSTVPRYQELLDLLRKEFELQAFDLSTTTTAASSSSSSSNSGGNLRAYREDFEQKIQNQLGESAMMQKAIVDLERAFYKMKALYEEEIARLKREIEARTLTTAQMGMVVGLGNGLSPNPSALPAFVMNTALTSVHAAGSVVHPVISLPQIPESSFGVVSGMGSSANNLSQPSSKRPRIEDSNSIVGSSSSSLTTTTIPSSSHSYTATHHAKSSPSASSIASPNYPLGSDSVLGTATIPISSSSSGDASRKHSISQHPIAGATNGIVSTGNAFRKVGQDWVILYNPKISPKTLDIDLAHSLGHENVVSCVEFSPNGLWLATGSDRLVSIYEVATGKLIHHQPISASNSNCSGGASGQEDANERSNLEQEEEKEIFVRSLAFSPDSNLLVAGGEDWMIHLIDVTQLCIVKTLSGHQQDVFAVEFTPDGKHILSGSVDRQLKVWSASTGENVSSIDVYAATSTSAANNNEEEEGSGVTSVAISSDGSIVACGCADKVIRLWDWSEKRLLGTLEGHEDSVYSIAFSSDSSLIASGSFDNTIRLWERQPESAAAASGGSYKCRKTINAHKSYVLTVAFTPDDKYVVSGSKDLKIHVWNIALEATQLILEGHYQQGTIFSVSISRDGKYLASGSGDRTARIWAISHLSGSSSSSANITTSSPESHQKPSSISSHSNAKNNDIQSFSNSGAINASSTAPPQPLVQTPTNEEQDLEITTCDDEEPNGDDNE